MPFHCHPAFVARRANRPVDGFAVLGDIIQSLGEEPRRQPRRRCGPTTSAANPRFDVYETSDEYVLEGELPGVSDKKTISIEFADARTLRVQGVVKRNNGAQSDEDETKEKRDQNNRKSVDTEMSEATLHADEKLPLYSATVEDTVDEDDNMSADFEVINTPRTSTPSPEEPSLFAEKPKEKATVVIHERAVPEQATNNATSDKPKESSNRKYWVNERSYGEFVKSFTFASFVDQESVKASLENGLLKIHVPKRQPYVRKVTIE